MGVQVFGPRLGVVFGSHNGVAIGVEIAVAARFLVCCRHSALMLVLSCVGNVILFPARCRLAWPALFVDAALVSSAILIRLRLGTIAMRPLCQLCEGHRPGRRYRCRRCEYLVGPGCVPQNCLFVRIGDDACVCKRCAPSVLRAHLRLALNEQLLSQTAWELVMHSGF